MGRTNWILAAIGMLACIALSLLMGHALEVREQRAGGQVAASVDAAVGARLTAPSRFRAEPIGGDRFGTLTVHTVLGEDPLRLAERVGATAWHALGRDRLDRLYVVVDAGAGARQRFDVAPPWSVRRRVVRVDEPRPAAGAPPAGR